MKGRLASQKSPRDARLTAINFVADAVNRALDLHEIADNALHGVLAVMKLDAGAVYVLDETRETLKLFDARGMSESFTRQAATLRRGNDSAIDAALGGETRVVEDFKLTPHLFELDAPRAGFVTGVFAPIRAQGFVVGLLVLGAYKARVFALDDVELIEVITNQIGNAMVHAQLQADLRANEERYRTLVENSDDAIFITDTDGRPRFANPAFTRMFGYDLAEWRKLNPYERVHEDDVHPLAQAVTQLVHGEPVRNLEYRFCRKDGAWIDLQGNGSVFSRDAERVRELQFVVREVTEARRRQEQLVRKNRQLAALTALAEIANSSLQIEEIARNTLDAALQTLGLDAGAIHLADAEKTRLDLYVHSGLPALLATRLNRVRWNEGLTGTVAATGELMILGDLTERPPPGSLALQHGFKALIIVPLKATGNVIGTLGLGSRRVVTFGEDVVDMVTAMGNQLGVALANARLYQAQLRENEKLAALADISGVSAQQLELTPLLKLILTRSAALLKADAAYMIRFDNVANQSEVVAATPPFEGLIGPRGPATRGLSGLVRESRQGRIFTPTEIVLHGYSPILRQAEVRSALVVPLISRKEMIGTLTLVRRDTAVSDFAAEDLQLMEVFAGRAAMAIDNAELVKDLKRKNDLLELLVEEAHHRIKNNLQMVSGLLQLQSETVPSRDVGDQLRSATTRIQAIAKVHNLLSQDMPEKVDAEKLVSAIVHTLLETANVPEMELDLEQLWLTSEQAVALALIVNELLSNALLHGRPPTGQPLRLSVACRRAGEHAHLTIRDNGGGFPAGVDWRRSRGQGMNIIVQLAQVNLRGALEISTRDGGVFASVKFLLLQPEESVVTA